MDQKTLDLFHEFLTDCMEAEKYQEELDRILLWLVNESEELTINFVLFIYYTVDRLAFQSTKTTFDIKEKELFDKLLLIEKNMESGFTKINHDAIYAKAIDVYSSQINNA